VRHARAELAADAAAAAKADSSSSSSSSGVTEETVDLPGVGSVLLLCIDEDAEEEEEPAVGSLAWCQKKLAADDDFQREVSEVNKLYRHRGHLLMFLPKYHCELAFSELYWGQAKRFTRRRRCFNWTGMTALITDSLGEGNIGSIVRQRIARKVRLLFKMYDQENLGPIETEKRAKIYKSHRPAFYTNAN
jgi:hypothetical protein